MVDDNYPLLIRYAALIFAFAILRYGDYIIKIRSLFDNVPPDIECMTVYRQLYINSRIFIDNFDELCIDYFRECIDVLESSDLMRCNSGVVSAVCEGVGYLCLESADYIKEYKLDKYIVLLKTTITGGEDHATFHLNLARLYCVNKEFSKAKTEVNIAINNIGGHNRNVRIFQFRNLYNRIVFNESLYEIERKNEENLKDIQDKYVARIEEEVRSGQKQSITILGIFSSIVITLVISANFFNGVLSNVPTDQFYEYVLLTLLVGLFLFNMLMVLILLVCKSISFDGLKSGLGIVRSEPDLGDVIKAKGAHPWYMWVFLAFNVVLVGCILAMYVFKYVLQ